MTRDISTQTLTIALAAVLVTGIGCGPSDTTTSGVEDAFTVDTTAKVEQNNEPAMGWQFAKTVDEFGDETEGGALIGLFEGTMSNSATAGDKVIVKVQVAEDSETTFFTFYEYGSRPASLPNEKLFNIKVKKQDNSTEFVEVFSMNGMLAETKGVLLGMILDQEKPLKFNVDLSRSNQSHSTIYNFGVDPEGLQSMMDQMKK